MKSAMRTLVALLTGVALAACTATSMPPTVTEQVAGIRVTHPVAWTSVAGPGAVAGGGLVPQFYLTNVTLTVTCPPAPSGGLFEGCSAPISALPVGGVLVTVSDAGSLGGPSLPEVAVGLPTDAWTGPCRSIGGERQVQFRAGRSGRIGLPPGPEH